MGIKDLERIHPVYRSCIDFCEVIELPYKFKEDLGTYETAIEFVEFAFEEYAHYHPPISENWETNPEINCPDILDYDHKIIIEFEEETGPRKNGAHLAKKGHGHEGDLDNIRDSKRNLHYKDFRVFRLWQSVYEKEQWKIKLFEFLLSCYKKDQS